MNGGEKVEDRRRAIGPAALLISGPWLLTSKRPASYLRPCLHWPTIRTDFRRPSRSFSDSVVRLLTHRAKNLDRSAVSGQADSAHRPSRAIRQRLSGNAPAAQAAPAEEWKSNLRKRSQSQRPRAHTVGEPVGPLRNRSECARRSPRAAARGSH